MYLYAALVYLAFNFLSYRLLMARGRMLDQMNEYTRVHDLLYWLDMPLMISPPAFHITLIEMKLFNRSVHTVFIAYAVCGMGLYSTAEFTIQPLKAGGRGRELCVLELSEGLSHTALLITLAVWDTGISLSILWLLTLSFRDTSSSLMPVLRRNIVGTSLAVSSTASFIVLITVMSVESDKNGGEGFLPGVAIAFAMHDVLINLLCINFIWPSTYYAKNLQRVFRKRCHDGPSKNNQSHSFSSRSVSRSREIRMMMNHVSGRVSKTKKKSLPDMIAERRQQNAQRKRNSFSNPNSVTLVAAEEDELHQQKITLLPAVAIESGGGGGEMKEQQLWISSNNFQHVPSPPASHSLSKVAPLATCERSGSDATAGGIILSSSGNFNCGLQQSSNSHLKAAGGPQINHQNLDESIFGDEGGCQTDDCSKSELLPDLGFWSQQITSLKIYTWSVKVYTLDSGLVCIFCGDTLTICKWRAGYDTTFVTSKRNYFTSELPAQMRRTTSTKTTPWAKKGWLANKMRTGDAGSRSGGTDHHKDAKMKTTMKSATSAKKGWLTNKMRTGDIGSRSGGMDYHKDAKSQRKSKQNEEILKLFAGYRKYNIENMGALWKDNIDLVSAKITSFEDLAPHVKELRKWAETFGIENWGLVLRPNAKESYTDSTESEIERKLCSLQITKPETESELNRIKITGIVRIDGTNKRTTSQVKQLIEILKDLGGNPSRTEFNPELTGENFGAKKDEDAKFSYSDDDDFCIKQDCGSLKTSMRFDRQARPRFLVLAESEKAEYPGDLTNDKHNRLWEHVEDYVCYKAPHVFEVSVSYGSWKNSKRLHIKLNTTSEEKYIAIHDTYSKKNYEWKQLRRRPNDKRGVRKKESSHWKRGGFRSGKS
eukprot:jgi/Bigna1/88724/estExt_fgenesh1_pg.C_370052